MKIKLGRIFPLFLFLVIAGFRATMSQPPTNEQFVISAVRDGIDKTFHGDSVTALLVVSGEKELELLIAGAIADEMRSKYSQVLLSTSPAPNAVNLSIDLQGFDFSFHKGASRGFLKAHKICRALDAQLRITIKSGVDGQLLEVKEISISRGDTIDPGWIKYVNSRNITELAPKAPSSGWSRYVEPALVIATVGALVYLFFANR